MLTDLDLLGDLEIVVIHVHTIVILKIDIHNTCMTIHPSMKIASSRFIGRWIIRYLRNYNHRGYDADIWLFRKLNFGNY